MNYLVVNGDCCNSIVLNAPLKVSQSGELGGQQLPENTDVNYFLIQL